MMRNKNILILTPVLGRAGVARVFHQQSKDLAKWFNVKEVVFNRNGYEDRFYDSGIELLVLDDFCFFPKFTFVGRMVNRFVGLLYLIRKYKVTAIISHTDGANMMNCLLPKKMLKITFSHSSRNLLYFNRVKLKLYDLLISLSYKRANHCIAVSEDLGKELVVNYRLENVETIRNYFDMEDILSLSSAKVPQEIAKYIEDSSFKLVSHGRYSKEKNFISLIHIIDMLKVKVQKKVQLILVGDGSEIDKLKVAAKKNNISFIDLKGGYQEFNDDEYPTIIFTGFVKNPFPILMLGDFYLLPSITEGYPLALCEAIICDLPVISSDCPTGPREILNRIQSDINNLLPVPVDDASIELWAECLTLAITCKANYADYLEHSLKLKKIIRYDKEVSINKLVELITVRECAS